MESKFRFYTLFRTPSSFHHKAPNNPTIKKPPGFHSEDPGGIQILSLNMPADAGTVFIQAYAAITQDVLQK